MEYSVHLITDKPHKYQPIRQSLEPETLNFFDGRNIKNFSKIVNQCVSQAQTEIVILCSDKCLPTQRDVIKTVELINEGYGFVGLQLFRFFGFKKELLRTIGMFDERYSGGWEDVDFIFRLIMANIAVVMLEETPYTPGPSGFDYNESENHYLNKWDFEYSNLSYCGKNNFPKQYNIIKQLDEEQYTYNLGDRVPTKFLTFHEHTWAEGYMVDEYWLGWFNAQFSSRVPIGYINKV